MNFLLLRWQRAAANSLVHCVPDAITNRYRFKLKIGKIRIISGSTRKRRFDKLPFEVLTII